MSFPFSVGDHIQYGDESGFITFIDHHYFTLCVAQWEDENTLHGYKQCNLLVYRQYWKECKKVDSSETVHD